jgi:hypothetical protein
MITTEFKRIVKDFCIEKKGGDRDGKVRNEGAIRCLCLDYREGTGSIGKLIQDGRLVM